MDIINKKNNTYPSDHNPKQRNKTGKDVSDILSMEYKFPTNMYMLSWQTKEDYNVWLRHYNKSQQLFDKKASDKGFLMKWLEDEDSWRIRLEAVRLCKDIDDVEIQNKCKEVLMKWLEDEDSDVRLEAIRLCKKEVLMKWLEDEDSDVRLEAIRLCKDIDDVEIQDKCKEVLTLHFESVDISSINWLHNNSIKNWRFGRAFQKTGSQTILLDRSELWEKVLVRVIELWPFLAWKDAFENYQWWAKLWYDYVPVEPIIKYTLQSDFKVRVYTKILDNNLRNLWLPEDTKLGDDLKKLWIDHGHFRDQNTCTWFDRDEKGNYIIDHLPRNYIIDFDQAKIVEDMSEL